MKKSVFLIISIFCIQLKAIDPLEPTTLFLGTIKFPKAFTNNDLCLYYKGIKLAAEWDKNNASAQFSFLESKTSQNLYILISNDIAYHADSKNTIKHLELSTKSYLCYELQATRIYDENDTLISFSWEAKECDLNSNIIPENTVIFLFNPDLVEGLQVFTWNKNQAMRLLPTIHVIDTEPREDLLVRSMTIAQLKALDLDNIHTKESTIKNSKIAPSKIQCL